MSNLVNFGGLVMDTDTLRAVDVRGQAYVNVVALASGKEEHTLFEDSSPYDAPVCAALRAWAAGLNGEWAAQSDWTPLMQQFEDRLRRVENEICNPEHNLEREMSASGDDTPTGLREAAGELAEAVKAWESEGWRWTAKTGYPVLRAKADRIANALDAVDALLAVPDAGAGVDEEKVALRKENERLRNIIAVLRDNHDDEIKTISRLALRVRELEAEEPTEEMVQAGLAAYWRYPGPIAGGLPVTYKAMRAARKGEQ